MKTLEERIKNKKFPCPLCEEKLLLKLDKKKKLYVICDVCGVQMFVRYPRGIESLLDQIEGFW